MKRSTFMAIAAILALLFGLAWILAPAQFVAGFGVNLEANGQWVGRYYGAALIGIAALTWLARNATDSEALRAVLIGNFAGSVVGLVVSVLDRLYGSSNAMGWSVVVIFIFLTAGFGNFQFVKPPSS